MNNSARGGDMTEERADVTARLERLIGSIREAAPETSERVLAAFRAVPRHVFVSEVHVDIPDGGSKTLVCDPRSPSKGALDFVYQDAALRQWRLCADGETRLSMNSLPSMTAQALTALEIEDGHRVLEVGAGTGYAAALLGHLVGHSGAVVSMEIVPEFAAAAQRTIAELGLDQVRLTEGDGALGYPSGAPFDRIMASVSLSQVRRAWLDQLRPQGKILLPLRLTPGGDVLIVLQEEGGDLIGRGIRSCGYQPLLGPYGYDEHEGLACTDSDSALKSLVERERESLDFIGAMVGDIEEALDFQFWLYLHDDWGALILNQAQGTLWPVALLDPSRTTLAAWRIGETRVRLYGGPEARGRFLAGYERWTQQGRPRPADLRMQVFWNDPADDSSRAGTRRPLGDAKCRIWFESSAATNAL